MKTNDLIKNNKRAYARLEFFVRILIGASCYPALLFLLPADTDKESEMIIEFMMALVPSIAIVFLTPILIRGSLDEKIAAILFLLPPLWFGFWGWLDVIGRFVDYWTYGRN